MTTMTKKASLGGSASTPTQRRLIHQACGYDQELKSDLVHNFSNGRTRTSMELTEKEANHLLHSLQNWAHFTAGNKQHSYVLSLCMQLGWSKNHNRYGTVADLERLSSFLKSAKCPVKKPLQSMSPTECTTLINCLESMISKHHSK